LRLLSSYLKGQKFSYGIFILLLICLHLTVRAEGGPTTTAIASSSPLATRAAAVILKQGGNAFDAAAAITAALAVVEPYASGFGGGGLWLVHRAEDGKDVLIDGREQAPQLTHRDLYLDGLGGLKDEAVNGPLAAAVPGIPAGIVRLVTGYGRLPLAKVLEPAITYAEKGFAVTEEYRVLARSREAELARYAAGADIFLDHNKTPATGYTLKQKDLAGIIRILSQQGHAGFYQGDVAAKLVNEVNKHGGDWTLGDLASYQIKERPPVVFKYHDMTVVSAPPPSAGGVVLGQAMKILEHFDIQTMDKVTRMHYIIEAMRRGYRDCAVYVGDPDFNDVPVARLLDPDYVDGLALTLDPVQATPSLLLGDTPGPARAGLQTTHFSIVDNEGNRVAGTLSISSAFGSAFVAAGTGVLLNNAMNDFSIIADSTPAGANANSIQPGKRPLTSMAPTFLETAERAAVLGTPGGNRIISMILLAALDFSEGEPLQAWISRPRYHQQYLPDLVEFEQNGLSFQTQRRLHDMGYTMLEVPGKFGDMQAALWDKQSNRVYAASDPRGNGEALVISR